MLAALVDGGCLISLVIVALLSIFLDNLFSQYGLSFTSDLIFTFFEALLLLLISIIGLCPVSAIIVHVASLLSLVCC